ncbi:MAG: hypothetical protein GX665_00035 [Gammaproteobacteria bacterium]|nr:hypothetical protein [Gammaproteobacteria bacterium]
MNTTLLLTALPLGTACILLALGWLLYRRLILVRALLGALLVLAGYGGYLAQADYGWHERVLRQLPADAIIVQQEQQPLAGRPWSEWKPVVSGLQVISGMQEVLEYGDGAMLEFNYLYFSMANGERPVSSRAMLNCATGDLVSGAGDYLHIESLPPGDAFLLMLCPPD